jgi:hypothetical protein
MTAALKQEAADKVVAIQRLANLLGGDITLVLADYMSAVEDVPLSDLKAGIDRAKKACPFFPRPAELREQCDLALRDKRSTPPRPQLAVADGLVVREYACTACEDSGWAPTPEALYKPGASYTVRKCFCREQNPVLAAQRTPTYGKKASHRSF